MTNEQIIKELLLYPEWNNDNLQEALESKTLITIFNEHCEKYSEYIEAGDIIDNLQETSFLMDTPDGYQEIGDFWIKKKRDIYEIKTAYSNIKVSEDHLIETKNGFIHTKNLKKGNLILSKIGYIPIIEILNIGHENVYDWEVLHQNHRYWCDGISSHNSGKTYLLLNMCREAQKLGYYIIYYDTEGAIDKEIVLSFNINPEEFDHQPVSDLSFFRTSITSLLKQLTDARKTNSEVPKILIALDSLGMLRTDKEFADAISGNTASDMTRAKMIRSIFRIITSDMTSLNIPFIFTNHTYQSTSFIPTINLSGGGGLVYSASVIINLTKAKMKEDGKNQSGIVVTANALKNRFAKPHKIKFHIGWNEGMNPYIGMEEYMNWDICGVQRGLLLTDKEYEKLKEAEKSLCKEFEFNKKILYFMPRDTAKTFVCKHLGKTVNAKHLFVDEVWTKEVIQNINEGIIKSKFSYGSITDDISSTFLDEDEIEEGEEELLND